MTEVANQLRALTLNKHVDIMCIGDPSKSLLLPLWATPTILPRVHHRIYKCGEISVRCNIWDVTSNTDAAHRMFPMDGTEHTGFDYCIIVYDAIFRRQKQNIDSYTDTKEQLTNQQHSNRRCVTVVLILKTPRTPESDYAHILDYTASKKIHCIPVDNTHEGLKKVRDLPERLCTIVLKKRLDQRSSSVDSILNASSSVKNG
jgi:hypothetical protein